MTATNTGASPEQALQIHPLPELLDAKSISIEMGVSRSVAESLMRQLPIVQFRWRAQGLRQAWRPICTCRAPDVPEVRGGILTSTTQVGRRRWSVPARGNGG